MKVSSIFKATILLLSLILASNCKAQSSASTVGKLKGWSNWIDSKCSVTCGKGTIRRRRICLSGKCKGKATAVKRCQAGNCQKWSEWSEYQPCDRTCGPGKQVRTRKCIGGTKCRGKSTNAQTCNLKPCPIAIDDSGFTFWTKFGACSDTCGGGVQIRNRTCPKGNCVGHLEEIRNCQMKACSGGTCTDRRSKCRKSQCKRFWRTCAKTCGKCRGNEAVSWGKYEPCSVTCGVGTRSRFKGSVEQKITCRQPQCTFPEDGYSAWSDYGKCSANCGGGTQERTRTCLNSECSKHDTEIRNCKTNVCSADKCRNRSRRCKQLKPRCNNASIAKTCSLTCEKCPVIVEWGEYGPCSAKCGAGLQTRTKGKVKQSITCFGNECDPTGAPNWGSWTESECTATCGGGTKTRSRICQGSNGCNGEATETVDCQTQNCPPEWTDWSDWTSCSATCGDGIRKRTRTCKDQSGCETLLGERTQRTICSSSRCSIWKDWSAWSTCTRTCGGGTMTRQRACSVPGKCEGEGTETTECNRQSCAEWADWTSWSSCSKSCGGGERQRKRTCKVQRDCETLLGERTQRVICSSFQCPSTWLDWSEWGTCTKTCGGGEMTRQRECSVPGQCKGEGTETSDCNEQSCAATSAWSDCSKSCDEGTRSRTNCSSGACVQEFEGCNMGMCDAVNCKSKDFFQSNRYGSDHECCNDKRSTPTATCGRTKTQKRVIGGVDAKEDQWPWMAAVQMSSGFCAGSIISENFVLSAAHCFAFDSGQPKNTTHWRIIPGILLIADVFAATKYQIASSYIHPDYNYPKADIALVKLTENIPFGKIQPICLPRGEKPSFDSTCYVTGWGVSTVPNTITNHLQELGILNFNPKACEDAYNKHDSLRSYVPFLKSDQGYLCAGSLTRSIDSCSGDSGGPLVCQRCDSCTWYVAGIVSFGPNPCAIIGVPGIYANVHYYEDWILQITGLPKYSVSCSSG